MKGLPMDGSERSLDTIETILQVMGLEVTDHYKGLVFVSNNLFSLRISQATSQIDLYFNEEIEEEEAQSLMGQLEAIAELHGVVVAYKGAFNLKENEDGTVSVAFFDLTGE